MKRLLFLLFIPISIYSQNDLSSIIQTYLDDNKSRYSLLDSDIEEFNINNEIGSKTYGHDNFIYKPNV